MNHSTLEIFIQVAETQSVTQAAKRLGRAQSNITTRIQQLEEELAVELFVRGNKKMVLSPAGVQFLSYARRILSLAEEAKQALHPTTPGGSLRLGAMEATATIPSPPRQAMKICWCCTIRSRRHGRHSAQPWTPPDFCALRRLTLTGRSMASLSSTGTATARYCKTAPGAWCVIRRVWRRADAERGGR